MVHAYAKLRLVASVWIDALSAAAAWPVTRSGANPGENSGRGAERGDADRQGVRAKPGARPTAEFAQHWNGLDPGILQQRIAQRQQDQRECAAEQREQHDEAGAMGWARPE